ncbi:MAG: glycosyltransferase [Clostridia bacterium]|nr:glycosyltransferase [Clostridia bacterium]
MSDFKKTKIRFFINTLTGGGAEKVLIDLLNQLDPDKYDISLLTIAGGVREDSVPKHVKYKKLVKNEASFFGRLWKKILFRMPKKLFAKRYLKGEYDVEVSYLEGTCTRFLAAKKAEKSKKLAFVHCDVSVKPVLEAFYKNKEECLEEYKKFDNVCFVSKMALEGFEKTYGKLDNSKVVYNVLDRQKALEKSLEKTDFEFKTKGLKIISVGRLTEPKGYDRLIEVASELEKEYDFELCILGDGEDKEKLEALIKERNVRSVRLLGYHENPYSYMAKADLFVCSSHFEGYSTTVSECLVLGVPVLTTDCAGMDELLDNGNLGIIVENSKQGIKDGLRAALQDKEIIEELKALLAKSCTNSNENKNLMEYENLFDINQKES